MAGLVTTGGHQTISEHDFITDYDSDLVGVWRASEKYSLFGKPGKLPKWIYEAVFEGTKGASAERDFYTPFKKGKEWLFELTCLHQPRTGALLMEGSDLFLRANSFQNSIMLKMGLEVQGKTVLIPRSFWGSNVSDWDEHGGIDAMTPKYEEFEWYESLPRPLADAYWNRFDGLNIPYEYVVGITHWMMPRQMGGNWQIIDSFLIDRYRGTGKKMLPWLNEHFPNVYDKTQLKYGNPYHRFRCILEAFPRDETRPSSEVLRSGIDSLWVEIGAKEPLIYLVTNGEFDKMRILTDPVEAVDRYCEHVLLNCIERFDFHQFSMPFG
jgi:hypothetical protein